MIKIYKRINSGKGVFIVLVLFTILISISLTLAATWKYGSLHQHTRFSSKAGYDGNPNTNWDDCNEKKGINSNL